MSKVLVTGGAGFIGSHLCERLLKENYNVICLDNFNDFYDPKIKEDNIADTLKLRNFTLVRGDILDRELLENIFCKYDIGKIIHLAAIAGVRPSLIEPQKYIDVDVKGTVNLLEMAKEYKIQQFIFGSSSSVYGISSKIPFSEDDRVDLQISPYAAAKRAGELYCATYSHLYGVPKTILRFFTVYGPRQRPDMAIHKFTKLMNQEKPISMFGDGKSERDYTYIDDVIYGILKAMKKVYKFEILNLGNSKTIKLQELIKIIADKLKIKPKIQQFPIQPGDVSITYADISKAKILLGYNPTVSIENGIDNFIKWYLLNKNLLQG
jgi:UDP-glucuronate 4-epimerase